MKLYKFSITAIWLKFWNNWKKYSKNLTMHGSLYFSESKSMIELIFWLMTISFCLALCIWLMLINWFRFESTPTVTTIRTPAYPTSNIQFPSVTVCNINTVYKSNIIKMQNELLNAGINKNLTDEFFSDLKYLHVPSNKETKKYQDIYNVLTDIGFTSEIIMRNVSQPCRLLLINCKYLGMIIQCSKIFKPIKTGYGQCCTFDVDANHKSLVNDTSLDKLIIAGGSQGLIIQIDVSPSQYKSPIYSHYSAIVMTHHHLDFPDMSTFSTVLQPGDFTLMQVIPTVYHADTESLSNMEVEKRSCWLNEEGQLISRKEYSFKNCLIECKVKAIYSMCDCVPYYYPKIGDYRQCTLLDNMCLKKYELVYNNFKIKMLQKKVQSKNQKNDTIICDCLPECTDYTFSGNINAVKDTNQSDLATVQIFFQYAWCVEYIRNLNMTWDMLLASLGGIYGLCLGGSIVSLIEIAYFLIKSIYKTFEKSTEISMKKIPKK